MAIDLPEPDNPVTMMTRPADGVLETMDKALLPTKAMAFFEGKKRFFSRIFFFRERAAGLPDDCVSYGRRRCATFWIVACLAANGRSKACDEGFFSRFSAFRPRPQYHQKGMGRVLGKGLWPCFRDAAVCFNMPRAMRLECVSDLPDQLPAAGVALPSELLCSASSSSSRG